MLEKKSRFPYFAYFSGLGRLNDLTFILFRANIWFLLKVHRKIGHS
jgi:hypothetical protein